MYIRTSFTPLGLTLAALIHSDGTGDATTTICHRYTPPEQLPVFTKTADIIVVATGTCTQLSLCKKTYTTCSWLEVYTCTCVIITN